VLRSTIADTGQNADVMGGEKLRSVKKRESPWLESVQIGNILTVGKGDWCGPLWLEVDLSL